MTSTIVSFDWKELSDSGYDSLKLALEKLNLFIYNLNEDQGSDSWLILISDKRLTTEEREEEYRRFYE